VLSSTNETTIEVDSLGNNEDFSLTITRAKFEELCMSILKEFTPIVEKTLKDAGKSKN
jgi:L1 cell adhesion molecule like protein